MEVTFRGGSFTEVGYRDSIFTPDPVLVAATGGLRNLCAERWRNCTDIDIFASVMDRHWFTFALIELIAYELVSHLLDREATP